MRSIVVFVAVSLLATSLAEAQEDSAKVGVGLAFLASNPVGQLTGTSTLYLPVQTGRSFRVEPTLGWHHASVEETSSDPTSPVNGISESSSALLLGIGLFGTARPGSGTLLYYGPRLGVAWSRVRDTDQAGNSLKESQTDWFAIAALGGEHRVSHLGVGGEVSLSYLHLGKPSFEQTGSAAFLAASAGGSSVGTGAAAFVRWYF
ncbi:MAG: hypothetical protein DMD33_13090 [Gemmatimonadetes bacterium]|nr:MAG: hypothetical protein DMD33_13090 [Gemmatimonadota bacterium]PYO97326.1 MAG: hypothetical protein DMD61_12535 [Gemmatimonadota bacterium]